MLRNYKLKKCAPGQVWLYHTSKLGTDSHTSPFNLFLLGPEPETEELWANPKTFIDDLYSAKDIYYT